MNSFNRTTVECKLIKNDDLCYPHTTFNRTTVECKLREDIFDEIYEEAFNRTTVECKLYYMDCNPIVYYPLIELQ